MLPLKIFENLHTTMAILVLLKNFQAKCVKFFDPDSECFARYDAFCSHIFNYACLGREAYSYRKGSHYRKIACIKNIFENGWWENAYSSSYPSGFAPGHKLQRIQRGRMQNPSKESGIF